MNTLSYDILRRDALGKSAWIKALPDLDAAKARVLHLAERHPGEQLTFHRVTATVVASSRCHSIEFHPSINNLEQESSGGA